jgi:hypothetical protein
LVVDFSREAGLIVDLSRKGGLIVAFSSTEPSFGIVAFSAAGPGFGRSLFVGLITDNRGFGNVIIRIERS